MAFAKTTRHMFVIAFVGLAIARLVIDCQSEAIAAASDDLHFSVSAFDRTLGNPEAHITLIEYGAPSCPVCARFNEDVFPLIKEKYIDTGKVRYVFRVFPLRVEDGEVEKLARCMPKNKYFGFMDILFRNQVKWDPEFNVNDPRPVLLTLAESLGLPDSEGANCIDDTSLDKTINAIA